MAESDREYAERITREWPEQQRRRRAMEERFEPKLRRLREMTHTELRALSNEAMGLIRDDVAADYTLLLSGEVAALALIQIQIINEERRRRIVSGAFGSPKEQVTFRAFVKKNKREDIMPTVKKRAAKVPPGQRKLL